MVTVPASSTPLELVARLVPVRRQQSRYFWQLPFNPDSAQQILAYLTAAGHEAPRHRKTKKATTNAQALKNLAAQTKDPMYADILDYRAVQKVDSTYALGVMSRLDANDRVHPEYLPIPSTFRDSARNPNLTNVVADKGKDNLAAGFRACIEARDGLPPGVTDDEYRAWMERWEITS